MKRTAIFIPVALILFFVNSGCIRKHSIQLLIEGTNKDCYTRSKNETLSKQEEEMALKLIENFWNEWIDSGVDIEAVIKKYYDPNFPQIMATSYMEEIWIAPLLLPKYMKRSFEWRWHMMARILDAHFIYTSQFMAKQKISVPNDWIKSIVLAGFVDPTELKFSENDANLNTTMRDLQTAVKSGRKSVHRNPPWATKEFEQYKTFFREQFHKFPVSLASKREIELLIPCPQNKVLRVSFSQYAFLVLAGNPPTILSIAPFVE